MKKREHLIAIALLLVSAFVLLGVLTSCNGPPGSEDLEETTKKQWSLEDLPDPPAVDFTGTAVPREEFEKIEPEYATKYAASSESDKYHDPDCHYVDQILPWNLIYFSTREAARRAGYTPCSVCDP